MKLDISFQLRSEFSSKFEIGYRCQRIRIRHHFFDPASHWSDFKSIKKSIAVKIDISFHSIWIPIEVPRSLSMSRNQNPSLLFCNRAPIGQKLRSIENSTGRKLDFFFQLRSEFLSKFEIGYWGRGIWIRHHFFNPSSHWSEIRSIKNSTSRKLDFFF